MITPEDVVELKQDVKDIKEAVVDIKITMERNTVSLEVHEKRTSLAEGRIKSLEYAALAGLGALVLALLGLLSYFVR